MLRAGDRRRGTPHSLKRISYGPLERFLRKQLAQR
jgi:hypothetical protein